METYTVAKILFTKEVQGQRGVQHNVRFTTNETGEKNISGFFDAPLAAGQNLVGEIVEKPGTNREGQPVIYNNFKTLPKRAPSVTGMSEEQYKVMMRLLQAVNTNVLRVLSHVDPAEQLTSAGTPVPNFTPETMNPPVEAYSDADFEEIDPASIPF